jgi:hypothetical protein
MALYGGVRFRTLLSARWAAFFDLAGWSWSYRPVDFSGWAPTFLLDIPTSESVWACVGETKSADALVARFETLLSRFVEDGRALLFGLCPLEGLGLFGVLPSPRWRWIRGSELGVDADDLWRRSAAEKAERPVVATPIAAALEDEPVDWRRRAEHVSIHRWASPAGARDWGVIVAAIGRTDPVLAGVLVGVDRAVMDDEAIDIWLPRYSIRGAILEGMGAQPRETVERVLHLNLQIHYTVEGAGV